MNNFKVGDTVVLIKNDSPWKKGEIFTIKMLSDAVAWDHKDGDTGKYGYRGVYLSSIIYATKLHKVLS